MAELKLARLPDRKPAKITITVKPELKHALQAYADAYREAYGEEETVVDLIPYMIEAFLSADRGFAKARKNGSAEDVAQPSRPRQRQQREHHQE